MLEHNADHFEAVEIHPLMPQSVRELMADLPLREADFVELYFFNHKTQTDIAEIFKVSQPTVCYRLQRATARIRFVLSLPDISVEFATEPNHTDAEGEPEFWPYLRDPLTLARPWAVPGTPGLVHRISDTPDIVLEHATGIGIGQHDRRNIVTQMLFE